jgi:hypothetical protein
MANSKTQICNLAVGWLGGKKITSLDDDSHLEARLCRANYDSSRKAVLEEREWTFAVSRVKLTPLSDAPLFGYDYKFLLPPNLLKITGVFDPRHTNLKNPPVIKYVREGNEILSDLNEVHVKFIIDLVNTNRFSALFDQAVAAHIAYNIAVPLTESAKQQERMFLLYENNLYKAISSDSLQGSNEKLETSQLENARRMFVRPE